MLVLCSVASDHFDLSVISLDWESESNNVIASPNHFKNIRFDSSFTGCLVVEKLNLLKETRLFLLVLDLAELGRVGLDVSSHRSHCYIISISFKKIEYLSYVVPCWRRDNLLELVTKDLCIGDI